MSNFVSNILLNGKTTTAGGAGIIAACIALVHGYPDMPIGTVWTDLGIVFTGLVGIFSKDYNVSGTGK
jgi:hypothetical protein